MNIDERYLKRMAEYHSRTVRVNKSGRLVSVSYIVLIAGTWGVINGYLFGLLPMAAGLGVIIYCLVKHLQLEKQDRKDFIDYYERTGELLQIPEGKKI